MRIRRGMAAMAMALTATAGGMGTAGAATTGTQGTSSWWVATGNYRITNQLNGQCLDVYNAYQHNEANVDTWGCNGTQNQSWYVSFSSDGHYFVKANHSGKCLTVNTSAPNGDFGGNVVQYDCVYGANQQWLIEDLHNGYVSIRARHNDKALDLDTRPKERNNVHNWTYYGNSNQQWMLQKL
jgi:hypothetical protein